MVELDVFRHFRSGVAEPSADARERASVRLATAIQGGPRRTTSILRPVRERPGRVTLAFTAVAGATAVALFVSVPWKSSPGVLERAQAALTPPAGTVVHMRWQETRSSTDAACRVTFEPSEMWIDQAPPYRYRGIVNGLPVQGDPSPCASGPPIEGGGKLEPPPVRGYLGPGDPAAAFREALENGTARDEGQTQLDGRTVERIRFTDPRGCFVPEPDCEPMTVFVDPETFYPVRIVNPNGNAPSGRFSSDVRYLTYEYLPGNAENRALADIRQHPNAKGP